MQELIEYLYKTYISTDHSEILPELSQCLPIPVASLPKNVLQGLTPLLIRNIAYYDQSTLKVQLSRTHILLFQRIVKLRKAMGTLHKEKIYMQLLNKWIDNGFFSFTVHMQKNSEKALHSLIDAGLLFEDYVVEKKQHYIFKLQELTKILSWVIHAQNCHMSYQQFSGLTPEKRAEAIGKKQKEKLEDYLIQLYGKDSLMVFRLIQKFKFITEKELQAKTLLGIIDLRKALNLLIEAGLLSFYAENARTTIYKAISDEKLTEKYLNHICKTILNLHVLLQHITYKQKLIKIQSAILALDDILLLFEI